MNEDKCWIEQVDGGPVRVQGSGDWTDKDRDMFAEVIRAAKAPFYKDQAKRTKASKARGSVNDA